MTAALLATPTPRPRDLRVTQWRVIRSEWTKFRSLRSTVWTMLMSVLLLIGLGAMFSAIAIGSTTGMDLSLIYI